MTRSHRRLAGVVALLVALLATALSASAASATHRPPTVHLGGHHRHHGPAHSCPGLGRLSGGQHVWVDRHGTNTDYMTRIVCSAADHSVVDVKMWYIFDEPGPAHRFLAALTLMHRYHHVQVNVHVGYDAYPQFRHHLGRAYLRQARRASPGAHWYTCLHACTAYSPRDISHTKFITVSRMRQGGGAAVFTTSANVSDQQVTRTTQSGILFTRNRPMWARFSREFGVYRSCALHRRCDRHVYPRGFTNIRGTGVYFAPTTIDPIAHELSSVDCSRGGEIDLVSLWLTRHTLVKPLRALKAAGCRLRVVVEHGEMDTAVLSEFGARVQRQHDKYLIIRTPTMHRTYEGSEDFGGKALHDNENVMVRTDDAQTYRAYAAEFRWQWSRSAALSTAAAHSISMAARARPES